MICKILVNGKEFGVNVYENNFDGEVQVNNTFHCEAEADGRDTIFGTNDENITVIIPMDEIKESIIAGMIDDVVDDLRSRGVGNTYNIDHAYEYTADRLADLKTTIANEVDQIMINQYTTQDGFTIIDDVLKDCPHKCGDCIGTDLYGEGCMHGCHDCGNNDGSTCLHPCSGSYGRDTCECACDCGEWNDGRY